MRHLAAIVAIATTVIATPAVADTRYVALRGSLAFLDDTEGDIGAVQFRGSFETGVGGSAAVGWATVYGLRVEAEGVYRYFAPDRLTLDGNDFGGGFGQVNVIAPMVNAFYEFEVDTLAVRPFIGAGVGAMYATANLETFGPAIVDDDAWGFAYQLMAGLRLPVAQNAQLTAMYRYLSAPELSFTADTGDPLDVTLTSHSVDVGLDFTL